MQSKQSTLREGELISRMVADTLARECHHVVSWSVRFPVQAVVSSVGNVIKRDEWCTQDVCADGDKVVVTLAWWKEN